LREQGGGELLVVSELVADFVDDLPCSEEKVALQIVAVHCQCKGEKRVAASVVENAGVGEPENEKGDPIGNSSFTQ
jgi:hypothetical protein